MRLLASTLRGIGKRNVATITTQFTGEFKTNPVMQARFMELVRSPSGGFSQRTFPSRSRSYHQRQCGVTARVTLFPPLPVFLASTKLSRLSSPVAQLVEQRTVNPRVPGSSPGGGAASMSGHDPYHEPSAASCFAVVGFVVGGRRFLATYFIKYG